MALMKPGWVVWAVSLQVASALRFGVRPAVCPALARVRAPAPRCLDDDDLMASLRARMSTSEAAPLGIEDVGADAMGPKDVIDYIMDAMVKGDLKTILGFCIKHPDGALEDMLGQVQPGSFSDPDVRCSSRSTAVLYIPTVTASALMCSMRLALCAGTEKLHGVARALLHVDCAERVEGDGIGGHV